MVIVSVAGTATVYHKPERAVLHVRIASEGPDKEIVSKKCTATTNQLSDIIKPLNKKVKGNLDPNAPVTWWSVGALYTGSYRPYNNSGKVMPLVYNARTTFQIKFKDFDSLGSFASTLSSIPLVDISSVEWKLTDATEKKQQSIVQRNAVLDALEKAKNYAAAMNLSNVTATEIADVGLLGGTESNHAPSFGGGGPMMRAMAAPGGSSSNSEDISFHPEDVQLDATVHARFNFT